MSWISSTVTVVLAMLTGCSPAPGVAAEVCPIQPNQPLRFVTIRCKYADGKTLDVKLSKRVDRCDYQIDVDKTLVLRCK